MDNHPHTPPNTTNEAPGTQDRFWWVWCLAGVAIMLSIIFTS